jgi:hypothetical protein
MVRRHRHVKEAADEHALRCALALLRLAAAVFGAITPIRRHGRRCGRACITGTLAALGGAILLVARTMSGRRAVTHTVRWLPVGGETS